MTSDVVDAYLAAAARYRATADVVVTTEQRQETVARDGAVEFLADAYETRVALRIEQSGRAATVYASRASNPERVVANAIALCALLSETERLPGLRASPPSGVIEDSWAVRDDVVDFASELTRPRPNGHDEARFVQQINTVRFGTTSGQSAWYTSSSCSVLFRATAREPHTGDVGHAEFSDYATSLAAMTSQAEFRVRTPAIRHAQLLLNPIRLSRMPETVLLEAPVSARLLRTLAVALQADSIVQRRSKLDGLRGHTVASDRVSLVDDPVSDLGPHRALFDDEGVGTSRRELIRGGTLMTFLADRRYGPSVGAPEGCGWRSSDTSPVRPRASNLVLEVGSPSEHSTEGVLRIVQIHGFHSSNEITGDFSVGASAQLEDDRGVHGLQGLTIAGNVFKVLESIEGGGSTIRWAPANGAYMGAPDLLVSGLAIGQ